MAYEAWPGPTNPRRCSWNFEPIGLSIREHGEAVVLNRHWKRVTPLPLRVLGGVNSQGGEEVDSESGFRDTVRPPIRPLPCVYTYSAGSSVCIGSRDGYNE